MEKERIATGALWDAHHPHRMSETVDESFQNLIHDLRHVHLKDARRNGGEWDWVVFDEGEVPVRDICPQVDSRRLQSLPLRGVGAEMASRNRTGQRGFDAVFIKLTIKIRNCCGGVGSLYAVVSREEAFLGQVDTFQYHQ